MSSGDSQPAPTYYFSGILFNPSFYTSSSSDYLTQTTAKKYFLSYPSAQGTETISNLISTSINYSSPLTGSFFDIGTNQVSGGTIRVGPTGATAGVSVHCGNIDFKNNTINNATAATTGSLSICDAQTQGVLNIATSSRVKASGTTNGDINIGTGINSIASGTIPPQINIGNNPSTLNATQILIGATNTTTTINGALSSGSVFQVPKALSNINYNTIAGAGGSVQTITVPSSGVYIYTFGANYNNNGVTTTTSVVAGTDGGNCRLFNQNSHPSYPVTYTTTGSLTFTIVVSSIPNSFNSFSVSYVKIG